MSECVCGGPSRYTISSARALPKYIFPFWRPSHYSLKALPITYFLFGALPKTYLLFLFGGPAHVHVSFPGALPTTYFIFGGPPPKCQDVSECVRMCQNVSEMCLNVSECVWVYLWEPFLLHVSQHQLMFSKRLLRVNAAA